jgi:hypothetical protein
VAQPSFLTQSSALEPQSRASSTSAPPTSAPPTSAPPVVRQQDQDALKPPAGAASNPVADVQAKLRAALVAEAKAKAKPSRVSDITFRALTTMACVFTAVLGLAFGVACVLLGTAIYLFPVTAGLSLAAVVISSGWLAYRLYTGSPKETAKDRNNDSPADIFEALSIGRFNAAGVA